MGIIAQVGGVLILVCLAGCATEGPPGGGGPSGPGGPGRGPRGHGPDAQALWKQYDLTGDGQVTRAEFMAVRNSCFVKADASGDGVLTLGELRKAFPSQPEARLAATLDRLDPGHIGGITREEFDRDSDRLFRSLDTNGDGVIAGNELSNLTAAVLGPLCVDTGPAAPAGRPPAPRR